MQIANQFRRVAFTPLSSSPRLRTRRLPVILTKITSLVLLATLVVVIWTAFSFVRTSLAGGPKQLPAAAATQPARAADSSPTTSLSKREPLVYLTDADPTY